MSNFIGAITALNSGPKYHKDDFEDYVSNPQREEAEAKLFGKECMPVGIYDIYMAPEKGDVSPGNTSNLNKVQYNIRDRFGYLSEDDYNAD